MPRSQVVLIMNSRQERDISQIAALAEPVRRRLYEYVAAAAGEVSREEAAEATGISRPLAAFHLDKLVEDGLLEVSFRRLSGRTGPGAGRPSKLYRRAGRQIQVSLPPRSYELAARLFAAALEASPAGDVREELARIAHDFGQELGARAQPDSPGMAISETLAEYGYEPFADGTGAIRLRNCPFHALAAEHRALVCGMNLSLLNGVLDGPVGVGLRATLDPQPGMCCVRIDGLPTTGAH